MGLTMAVLSSFLFLFSLSFRIAAAVVSSFGEQVVWYMTSEHEPTSS